ncbi:MAG: zinc metallopeptidase [Deltaproteobacteria bacterium]|nr:zinc metallopeptidase [Deltaproteobacteria bacterium]
MFYFDPLYMVVMLVSLGASLWATAMVKSAFAKYRKIPSTNGLTGREIAERILAQSGVSAAVSTVDRRSFFGGDGGDLTDHYDPRDRTVRLSPQVYGGTSIAAQAIAAHEVGHAIQHARAYTPLTLRNAIAPVAGFGSNISYFLIMIGFVMNTLSLVKLGILFFAIVVAFQLITLPVEFDASRRAKQLLQHMGIIVGNEGKGVAAVLNAAALTYVAAAATALLNLAYLLLRARER